MICYVFSVGEEVKGTWCFHKYGQIFKQCIAIIFLIKIYTCNYCLPKTTEEVSFKKDHLGFHF